MRMQEINLSTPWVEDWRPDFIGTLVFVVDGSKDLLIRNKTGHGMGKINGPGGKLEEGETITDCAVREVREETGLIVDDLLCKAELRFVEKNGSQWLGFAFVTKNWKGELLETSEAKPFWSEMIQSLMSKCGQMIGSGCHRSSQLTINQMLLCIIFY